MYLKGGITARKRMEAGEAGTISVLENGQYNIVGDGADAFKTLTVAIAETGTAPSTLIKLQNAWFHLDAQTNVALTLTHLAGPIPALEAQTRGALEALILYEPEANRAVGDRQIAWALLLKDQGRIKRKFNLDLFTKADSTYPELAGAAAAIVGSLFTMLITSFFALPVGILAAVYLEEFAPKNRLTDIIEVRSEERRVGKEC